MVRVYNLKSISIIPIVSYPYVVILNSLVVAILFDQHIDVNERDVANNAQLLMTNVVPYVWNNVMDPPPGILSSATSNLLNTSDLSLYALTDSIFQNDDPKIYPELLNMGCSNYYNDGQSCDGTAFYEPNEIRGGVVGVMSKCLLIRGDKCRQCQCIVNNALYNHAVPEKITTKIGDSVSTVLATLLEAVKTGGIDLSKWFEINANARVGIGFEMYPSLIGFLIGVALSIVMVLCVNTLDHQNSTNKHQNTGTNENEITSTCSLLFSTEDENQQTSRIKTGIFFIVGAGIVPFIFCAVYIDMFNLVLGRINYFVNIENGRGFEYSMVDLVVGIRDGSDYKSEFTYLYAILLLAAPM